jgi:predicted PurR-regulated permease PerM
LDFLRARAEQRYALVLTDPKPVESVDDLWTSAAQLAVIGIFILLLGTAFYFGRAILLPIFAALVIGMTFAPLVKRAAQHRVSPWITATAIGVLLLVAAGAVVTLIAKPLTEWIGKAPEIGEIVRQKLYVLERPLAALRDLQAVLLPASGPTVSVEPSKLGLVTPVLEFVTPAVGQIMLFFVTLIFFLAAQMDFRRYMVSFFAGREAKLRYLRIAHDIESNLASYVATVTVINLALGAVVAASAWLFGYPNPLIFGVLAAVLNYVPYVGPALMVLILFGVGLVTFPSLGYALIPSAAFVALATFEGHILTPTILGRRLTLNPLAVLLALAFWTWLWGPMGAFLAVPLSIVGLVTINHLFPGDESKLPG